MPFVTWTSFKVQFQYGGASYPYPVTLGIRDCRVHASQTTDEVTGPKDAVLPTWKTP